MIEVHVKENLPMIQTGKYSWDKTRAVCEFCGQKHTYKVDHCELKFDGVPANESVETSTNATIGQILEMITHERRLILAIVFKRVENRTFCFNELEPRYTTLGGASG